MALALGTNGVRGLFDELHPAAAMDFGYAFAQFVKKHPRENAGAKARENRERPLAALARDMRATSPCISQAVAAGLMEGGCDVLDIGIATSPMAEWANGNYGCDGLVIVTASHNPPQWNALKFVDGNGVAVSRQRGADMSRWVGKPHAPALEWQQIGRTIDAPDAIGEYKKAVLAFVDRKAIAKKKRWKIVADVGNGTSTLVAPALFRALGADVVVLNEKLDGSFPGRPSEPTEGNVKALIEAVPREGADFGVAYDGDADRVVFVDGRGRWLVGDKCVALAARWALQTMEKGGKAPRGRKPETRSDEKFVVTTVATSRVVEDVAAKHGAKIEYTDVGAPYLAERMRALGRKVVSGGEEVGGIVWPRFSLAKDGVLAACKLMEMVAIKPLAEWHDELPRYYNSKTKIACKKGENARLIARLLADVKTEKTGKNRLREVQGGFRLDMGDSWVLARASGTEDYIRVFAESPDEGKAASLMNEYKARVEKTRI